MNTKAIIAAIGVLLPVLLAGCGESRDAARQSVPAAGPAVIKVPTKAGSLTPNIFTIGEAQGFFAEHNIKLEVVGPVPSSQAIAATVAGTIDVAHPSHINRTIAGIAAGAKVKAVVACQETSERVPHMVGVIKKDSPLRGARDLIGKKIGITQTGGCHEYTPYAYLRKNGVENPKNQVEIVILPEKQLEQALRQGELDLIMLHKIPEEINRAGEFAILFSDYDVWGALGGATPLFVTEKFIKERPEVLRNFVAAVVKTLNWANAHPEEAKEITAKGLNMRREEMTEGYYVQNALIKEETISLWIDLLTEFGEIKEGVKPEQIYTNEFNPYYKKK
jgi:ABC-type nitrate/sulfonate/bicarbonate transport system substrate-binding protein